MASSATLLLLFDDGSHSIASASIRRHAHIVCGRSRSLCTASTSCGRFRWTSTERAAPSPPCPASSCSSGELLIPFSLAAVGRGTHCVSSLRLRDSSTLPSGSGLDQPVVVISRNQYTLLRWPTWACCSFSGRCHHGLVCGSVFCESGSLRRRSC